MKILRSLIFLLISLLLVTACKKNDEEDKDSPQNTGPEVNNEQWALAINYTATWCFFCGDWGAPMMHDLNNLDRVVCLSLHSSGDPMNNGLYNSFSSDRLIGTGIPSFWIGDLKSGSSNSVQFATTLKSQFATAGLGMEYTITGDIMDIKVKAKFFEAGNGDYYLSVLLLEDGIDGSSASGTYQQNGTGSSYPNDDYIHNYVVRMSADAGKAYGEVIVSNPTTNQEVTKEYSLTINENWENFVYPVAILWRLDEQDAAPHYKFINAIK